MANMNELIEEVAESINVLHQAQQTVLEAAEELASTRENAESAKNLAEAALPLAGGTMTGAVSNLKLAGLEALSYDAGAVNGRQVMDYAPEVSAYVAIHVNSDSVLASDTADLNNGRGLSENMPFASLPGALSWASRHYSAGTVVEIILHSDITLSEQLFIKSPFSAALIIRSDDTLRTINVVTRTTVQAGCVKFRNLNFNAASSINSFLFAESVYGSATMIVLTDAISFNGVVSQCTLASASFAKIYIMSACALTGNVSGKKYALTNGAGLIISGKTIPGTVDGTKDASCVVQ